MSSARLRYQTIEFGDLDIHLRTLRDTNEFDDEGGVAEALGVPPAMWPMFGVVWDSSRVLAGLMLDQDIHELRILEVGCGIGLASLVLNHRHADITATDRNPHAEGFLEINTELNGGAEIPFVRTSWLEEDAELGLFDLIIGSDLLYERASTGPLSGFIDRHAEPRCEVILVDPGRGHTGHFTGRMEGLGYTHEKRFAKRTERDRVQIHSYQRQELPVRGST